MSSDVSEPPRRFPWITPAHSGDLPQKSTSFALLTAENALFYQRSQFPMGCAILEHEVVVTDTRVIITEQRFLRCQCAMSLGWKQKVLKRAEVRGYESGIVIPKLRILFLHVALLLLPLIFLFGEPSDLLRLAKVIASFPYGRVIGWFGGPCEKLGNCAKAHKAGNASNRSAPVSKAAAILAQESARKGRQRLFRKAPQQFVVAVHSDGRIEPEGFGHDLMGVRQGGDGDRSAYQDTSHMAVHQDPSRAAAQPDGARGGRAAAWQGGGRGRAAVQQEGGGGLQDRGGVAVAAAPLEGSAGHAAGQETSGGMEHKSGTQERLPKVKGHCKDFSPWEDLDGNTCDVYNSPGWKFSCIKAGGAADRLDFERRSDGTDLDVAAREACCACGGSETKARTRGISNLVEKLVALVKVVAEAQVGDNSTDDIALATAADDGGRVAVEACLLDKSNAALCQLGKDLSEAPSLSQAETDQEVLVRLRQIVRDVFPDLSAVKVAVARANTTEMMAREQRQDRVAAQSQVSGPSSSLPSASTCLGKGLLILGCLARIIWIVMFVVNAYLIYVWLCQRFQDPRLYIVLRYNLQYFGPLNTVPVGQEMRLKRSPELHQMTGFFFPNPNSHPDRLAAFAAALALPPPEPSPSPALALPPLEPGPSPEGPAQDAP